MVSVVATLHFQSVSQKWHDGLTSDLACACNWFSRCALFSGDLKLPVVTYLIKIKVFRFQTVSQKWVDEFNSNLACGCNWFSRCALF